MWGVIRGLQPIPSSPRRREPSSRSSVSSRNDSFESADAPTTRPSSNPGRIPGPSGPAEPAGTARHARPARVDLPLPAVEPEDQVGSVGDDAHFLRLVESLRVAAHAVFFGLPVEEARAVEEVLELGQRHPGLLRERGSRVLAADPLELEGEDPLDVWADAGLEPPEPLLVEAGALTCVLGSFDPDPGVGLVEGVHLDRR